MTELETDLLAALEKSVELQSHYAYLLNMYDGGRRMQFASADEWRARLTQADATESNQQRKAEI